MDNVVYIKHFDNGKKYIGITKHFDKRMKEHERAKDNLMVHKAMRKYSHYTEIVFRSTSYKEVLDMERIVIQNYIDLGYNLAEDLYNMTLGGEGTLGCTNHADVRGNKNPMYGKTHSEEVKAKLREFRKNSIITEETRLKISKANSGENNPMYGKTHSDEVKAMLSVIKRKENLSEETLTKMRESAKRGQDNHNSHPIEYYSSNPITRGDFKSSCKNQGWEFNHFKEVYSGQKANSGHKLFLYEYMGEGFNKEVDYSHELHKPKEYYATKPMIRANFKRICITRGWDISEFTQIRAERCVTPSGRAYYKYYYVSIDKF